MLSINSNTAYNVYTFTVSIETQTLTWWEWLQCAVGIQRHAVYVVYVVNYTNAIGNGISALRYTKVNKKYWLWTAFIQLRWTIWWFTIVHHFQCVECDRTFFWEYTYQLASTMKMGLILWQTIQEKHAILLPL